MINYKIVAEANFVNPKKGTIARKKITNTIVSYDQLVLDEQTKCDLAKLILNDIQQSKINNVILGEIDIISLNEIPDVKEKRQKNKK